MSVTEEIAELLARLLHEHNVMWALGEIPAESRLRDVDPSLVAAQYSPRFEGGVWRAASGEEWMAGTAEAARLLGGQGCHWELTDLTVLERDPDEAVASYRIVHHWGDDRPPALALFLETWRRTDGRWLLLRHHAEKV
jgi:hypothetical protein